MNYNSPKFSNKMTSPQNSSGFVPFSSSSPKKQHRGPMRYFNPNNNSSTSNGSPYKPHHRNNRDNYNKDKRNSSDSTNILSYYDPSAMDNPWAELEKEYEEKHGKDTTVSENLSTLSTS